MSHDLGGAWCDVMVASHVPPSQFGAVCAGTSCQACEPGGCPCLGWARGTVDRVPSVPIHTFRCWLPTSEWTALLHRHPVCWAWLSRGTAAGDAALWWIQGRGQWSGCRCQATRGAMHTTSRPVSYLTLPSMRVSVAPQSLGASSARRCPWRFWRRHWRPRRRGAVAVAVRERSQTHSCW